MTDVRGVTGPGSPLSGRDGRVLAVIVIAVLVAVIKPWGAPSGTPDATPIVLPSASVVVSPDPTPTASDPFDFGIFEGFEPQPAWEVWPAGQEISFGFAMRIDADGARRSPAPGSSSVPGPDPVDPGPPPTWSQVIAISPAATLTVVAINLPLAYRIPDMRLTRRDDSGREVSVPLVRLPSPWPDHFLVVGIGDGTPSGALPAWPPGDYALELEIEPGGWTRTISIDVQPMPAASPSPVATPSDGPSPAASPSPGPS